MRHPGAVGAVPLGILAVFSSLPSMVYPADLPRWMGQRWYIGRRQLQCCSSRSARQPQRKRLLRLFRQTKDKQDSCLLEAASKYGLCIVLDLPEVLLATEAFRVNLVDILCSRWPGSKPAVLSDHLYSADRFVIAGSSGYHCFNRLFSQRLGVDLRGVQAREELLLLARGRRIRPFVKGFSHIFRRGP